MISYHPNKYRLDDWWNYNDCWRAVDTDDPERIAKAVVTYRTSPCIWIDGVRLKKNFSAANWIALDFDDSSMVLSDALELFKEYTHVIGPSKNHQREKKGKGDKIKPACDRFHVYLKLPITISNRMDFEACVRYWVQFYHADLAAVDAARMFSPCREVISVVKGKDIPVRQILKPLPYAQRVATTPESGIPRWVQQLLILGPGPGISRNTTCYKVAIHLMKAGYTDSQALSIIMGSAIPIDGSVEAEVRDTVKNAVKSMSQ